MSKLPFMQFYPGDWIRDTRCLSISARGMWIDLICALWDSPTRGTLTWPESTIAQYLGMPFDSEFEQLIAEVCFMNICNYSREACGLITITCRRMIREERQRKQSHERVKRFRNADCNADVTQMKRPIYQKSEVRSHINTKSAQPEGFADFWDQYPRKKNKGQAEKAWKALKPDGDLIAKIRDGITRGRASNAWQKDAGQFIPYPATWLRAKGWEDDDSRPLPSVAQIRPRVQMDAISDEERQRTREMITSLTKRMAVK